MPRAKWRTTLTQRFTPRLQAGFEWNPNAQEVNLIGNWVASPESERTPMVNFGTSSDRIGTPAGPRAYFVTFAKSIPSAKLGPYFSINYSEFDKGFNFPFGTNYQISPGLTTMFMNDGRKSHLLLTYTKDNWSVTPMLIWMKRPGISISFGF